MRIPWMYHGRCIPNTFNPRGFDSLFRYTVRRPHADLYIPIGIYERAEALVHGSIIFNYIFLSVSLPIVLIEKKSLG